MNSYPNLAKLFELALQLPGTPPARPSASVSPDDVCDFGAPRDFGDFGDPGSESGYLCVNEVVVAPSDTEDLTEQELEELLDALSAPDPPARTLRDNRPPGGRTPRGGPEGNLTYRLKL